MKLGNDIIEIDRIRQALEKSQSFRDRVYTPQRLIIVKAEIRGVTSLMLVYMPLKRLSLKH